jgi:alpha-L-rhamnosidase
MKTIWFLAFLATIISDTYRSSMNAPEGLMVEFIRQPDKVQILDSKPEFSWIVPVKAGAQTAFRILVSSSEIILTHDEGDLWDSEKTLSSRSVETEYNGRNLSDNSVYYWKVKIWNEKGKPSSWSEVQSFRTGVLNNNYATTPNRIVVTFNNPKRLVQTRTNNYFADFGKDAFGKLQLEITPSEKDTIIVHLGEKAESLNRIDREPGGTIRYYRIVVPVDPSKDHYKVDIPADSRNTGPDAVHLPDTFGVLTPFRYCEIENCRYVIGPGNINRKTYWHFFEDEKSSFDSSDTILNKVWDICKYTIKATSFTGLYIDGDRERIPYEADAYINQLGHYYTDREYSMARRTNEYFINHPTWPTEWILQTVLMFYNDLMFTGNYESVIEYYKELQHKTLVEIARPDGLISSNNVTDDVMKNIGFADAKERIRDIVDWPPSQKDTGWKLANQEGERDGYDMTEINTVVNAFHYRTLVLMAEIAGYIGKTVDYLLYKTQADKVKDAINEKLFDHGKGIYLDGEFSSHSSLHANMMALAFNLVPEKHKKTVVDFIKSRGMACSVYGSQFLLEGLYNAGESDYAFGLMTAIHDRSWWNMIRSGSTMTMEAWDMKYKPNSDWNHAWGAAPANIIPGCMWGIRPVKPGYAKAIIKPQLNNLKNTNINVPTIRGNITAEFSHSGNSKDYLIAVPANMECDFVLAEKENQKVIFNGKKQKAYSGILHLIPGTNKISFYQ